MAKSKLEKSIEDTAKLAEEEVKANAAPEETEEPEEETVKTLETKEKPDEDGSHDDQGNGKEQAGEEKEEGEGNGSKPEDGKTAEDPGKAEEVLDPKEAAFLRRENRRLKARAEAAAVKPAVAEAPVKAQPVDPMPDRSIDPDGYRDWKDRQIDAKLERIDKFTEDQRKQQETAETYQKAGAELNGYVETFSKEVPDAKAVLGHAGARWKQSFKDIHPRMSDVEIDAAFGKFALTQAAEALNRGEDPAESLYNMAVERYGRPAAPEKPRQAEKPKPNLARIDASRRKSATPLNGGGQGSENMTLTKAAVAAMPLHEFAQVDEKTLRMLEGEAD